MIDPKDKIILTNASGIQREVYLMAIDLATVELAVLVMAEFINIHGDDYLVMDAAPSQLYFGVVNTPEKFDYPYFKIPDIEEAKMHKYFENICSRCKSPLHKKQRKCKRCGVYNG